MKECLPQTLTKEDYAIIHGQSRRCDVTVLNDRLDAKVMRDAQVMRYWSGYKDGQGCEVDLRLDHLQRF